MSLKPILRDLSFAQQQSAPFCTCEAAAWHHVSLSPQMSFTNFFRSLSVFPFMTLQKRSGDGNLDCFVVVHGQLKHVVAATRL